MSKAENIFKAVFDRLYQMDQPIQADYNYLQELDSEKDKDLVTYINEVLTGISTVYNFLRDVLSSLYAIEKLSGNEDDDRARFIVSELEEELKEFHIKIKSLFDVIIRFAATVFRIKINNKIKYYDELMEKLPADNQIGNYLETIKALIDGFDMGRRNKIIHEGTYKDDEINEAHLDGMLRGIHKKLNYKKSYAEEVNELIKKKLDTVEQVCTDVSEQFMEVLELIDEEYDKN